MALSLTTDNEIRCISHVRSCTSPSTDTMLLPKLRRETSVDSPNTPDVSTAIGWESTLSVGEAYFLRLLDSALLASALARIAERIMLDGLNVSVQVASQTRDLPLA